jgi:restriction system protein
VDAIAYDPEPIRGGKIVIQAKRYTNTLGVAAVRDLLAPFITKALSRGFWSRLRTMAPTHMNLQKTRR